MRHLLGVVLAAVAVVLTAGVGAYASHGLGYHWADNDPSYPRGYVYWVDNTGAEWPVYSAAVDWDAAPRVDAVYVSGAGACPSHCVTVSEADLDAGCTGRLGVMNPDVNASGHLTGNTFVRIDRQCDGQSYANRRELVCHELGHSLGLDDRPSSATTCMRQGMMVGRQHPGEHDFDMLHAIYNHNDPG